MRDRQIADLREADIGSKRDIVLRYIVVIVSGVLLYWATSDPLMLIWLGVYLSINSLYARRLFLTTSPVSVQRYVLLLVGNFFSSGLFAAMPIYLVIFCDPPALKALALAGMIGHALFNLSRHTTYTPIAFWDMFSIIFYCFAAAYSQVINAEAVAEIMVFCASSLTIAAYYVHAQLSTILMHQKMMAVQELAAHDQKISAIGRLTGGVAHDFNNLLTVVKGNLELYHEIKDPSERTLVIREAHAAAERAEDVIAQLLSFARQSKLAPRATDLDVWARELEMLITRLLPETITAQFDAQPSVTQITVDTGQLSSAVMNLAINARDAMGTTPGRLDIRIDTPTGTFSTLAGILPQDDYLRISLQDTGSGMDEATLARVTEPFFTTKEVGRGSGLGLSMARGFAEQSGGGLMIESAPGRGTKVTLYFKLVPAKATDQAQVESKSLEDMNAS